MCINFANESEPSIGASSLWKGLGDKAPATAGDSPPGVTVHLRIFAMPMQSIRGILKLVQLDSVQDLEVN